MKNQRSRLFGEAIRLLDDGHALAALEIAEKLVSSDDPQDKLSGYFCRGAIYEDGGADFSIDIDRAIYNYRQVALLSPDWVAFNNLARMYMKKGGSGGFEEAKKYLDEAARIEISPEVLLGYALYYRKRPDSNVDMAKRFYLKAALRGRFYGLFGYSEVAREVGQPFRAIIADCARIFLGPFVVLLIGSKARNVF